MYTYEHIEISGFIKNNQTQKYAYFSCSDVRFSNEWYNNILVRAAKNEKDYTGGANHFTDFKNLVQFFESLTA